MTAEPRCPDCDAVIGVAGMSEAAVAFELRRHQYPHDGLGCPALRRGDDDAAADADDADRWQGAPRLFVPPRPPGERRVAGEPGNSGP